MIPELCRLSARALSERIRRRELSPVEVVEAHLAHIEAHRLEHAISPNLEDRIVAVLNNPETCPFGHPIPGSGYKPNRNSMSLDMATDGSELIIDSVPEDDQPLLEYFVDKNILPGRKVRVNEAARTRGVITLRADEGEVVFSYDIAAKIRVYPA